MDLQYAPMVLASSQHTTMQAIIAEVARQERVGLFPRFALMRRSIEAGVPSSALLSWDGLHNSGASPRTFRHRGDDPTADIDGTGSRGNGCNWDQNLMVLSKINRRVASSKLLFQQNFDRASNRSAFSAHYKAVIAAMLFLGFAFIVAGPVRSDYWVAESLLNRGLTTIGTIERVDVKSQPRGRGSKDYITTVDYRFVGSDGQVYRGSSSYTGDKPQRVATGDEIEIVHDPHRPSISGWRTALQGTKAAVYSVYFIAILFLPWCVLWLYRYARWRQHRSSLPI